MQLLIPMELTSGKQIFDGLTLPGSSAKAGDFFLDLQNTRGYLWRKEGDRWLSKVSYVQFSRSFEPVESNGSGQNVLSQIPCFLVPGHKLVIESITGICHTPSENSSDSEWIIRVFNSDRSQLVNVFLSKAVQVSSHASLLGSVELPATGYLNLELEQNENVSPTTRLDLMLNIGFRFYRN